MEKIFCQDIEDSEFARLDDSEKDSEFVAVESKTYFQDAWGRFKKNKLALVSLVFMAVVILFAVFAPMFSPYTYDGQDLTCRNALPNAAHWFGTDKFGLRYFCTYYVRCKNFIVSWFCSGIIKSCDWCCLWCHLWLFWRQGRYDIDASC